jgi:hypothetical protein
MNRYLLEAAATILASLTAWLVVTDPVTIADAISTWSADVLLRIIVTTLLDIFRILIAYL